MENITEFQDIINGNINNVLNGREFGSVDGKNFVIYGTENQAARQAIPVEEPEYYPEEEQVVRAMPSAQVFETVGSPRRRNRSAGALKTIIYAVAITFLFFGFFKIVELSGELNAMAVETSRLSSKLASLEAESEDLESRIASKMTELDLKDYAVKTLGMVDQSEVTTKNISFSAGEQFVITNQTENHGNEIFSSLKNMFEELINSVIGGQN